MSISILSAEALFPTLLSCRILLAVLPFLLAFAIFIAYIALDASGVQRLCIDVLINLPIVFPPIGIGFVLVYLFGGEGLLGKKINADLMFSFPGLVLAAFITGAPFIAQTIVAGIDRRVARLCEASYTLGKGKVETFVKVVLPLLGTNIIAGILLASARILGEVGISLMIGGNIRGKTNTISLEIYNAVLDGENGRAWGLSILLLVVSTAIFAIIKLLVQRERT